MAITGALVQWIRDNFGLIGKSAEIETLARTVDDNGGVYFVPAFSGLYAPYWKHNARGVIAGLTRYTNKGHLARAVLEATAFQTREVVEAMEQDSGMPVGVLRTDGGMVENDLLMQFQSRHSGPRSGAPRVKETTALGAAYAAGLAVGFYASLDDLRAHWSVDRTWKPAMEAAPAREDVPLLEEGRHALVRLAGGGIRRMGKRLFGEFMGTMVLILMGNGVVANVLLRKSKAEGAGWMVIATGWAFAVMIGVFTAIACGSADAHLESRRHVGRAVVTGDFSKFLPYPGRATGRRLGGATLVWLHFCPHWRETPDPDRKLACFCTSPAIRNPAANLIERNHRHVRAGAGGRRHRFEGRLGDRTRAGLGPYLVGSLVWGIGLSLGGTTGYAINPARDLGPRIAHALLPIAKKARFGLGLRARPDRGPAGRRRAGGTRGEAGRDLGCVRPDASGVSPDTARASAAGALPECAGGQNRRRGRASSRSSPSRGGRGGCPNAVNTPISGSLNSSKA